VEKSIFLIKALSDFSQHFKLPWLFFLFIFTQKPVVFCKTLISICSASFRFFRYMNWWYGPSKTKNDKNVQKNFLPGPPKTCWVFLPTFFKSFRYGWILYAERIFRRVLLPLHRSLNKTTVLQQGCFFSLPDITNTPLRQQTMRRHNVLRVDVASEVSQKSQWNATVFAPGQSSVARLLCKSANCRLYLVNVHCLCTS